MRTSAPHKSAVFTGDFCVSGDEAHAGISAGRVDPWSTLRNTYGDDAAIITNLECPFTRETNGLPFKWATLKASPELHWILDGLSLTVLGNNHIADFGVQAAMQTRLLLENKGIKAVGYGASLDSALQPAFLDIAGKKLGVVSLCCPTTNSENLATHLTPGVAPLGMATLRKAVSGARPLCDALVVYLHWGREWVHDPVPDQLRLARQAVDCGADAVIGCHSHTIQSYEQYRGRWIFYGLGNYLFKAGYAQVVRDNGEIEHIPLTLNPANRESLAVSFHIESDSGAGCLKLDNVQPMRFSDDFLPRPIEAAELTFNLEAANERLRTYVDRHVTLMRDYSEPVFRAQLLNGSALAYSYQNETIVAPKLLNRLKHIASSFVSGSSCLR